METLLQLLENVLRHRAALEEGRRQRRFSLIFSKKIFFSPGIVFFHLEAFLLLPFPFSPSPIQRFVLNFRD